MIPNGSYELWIVELRSGPLQYFQEKTPPANRPDVGAARTALEARALERARQVRALAYERRNANWLESAHRDFPCREVSEFEVAVETPVGVFRITARRARKGEVVSGRTAGPAMVGMGRVASEDQVSPPVVLHGSLCPLRDATEKWLFQPSSFTYEDGTSSDFLGSYPMDIRWEQEPPW